MSADHDRRFWKMLSDKHTHFADLYNVCHNGTDPHNVIGIVLNFQSKALKRRLIPSAHARLTDDSARQGVFAAFLETGGQTQHLRLIAAGNGADGNDLGLAFGQGDLPHVGGIL